MNTVTADTLKSWIQTGEAVVIDVREPAEHRGQHIKGSIHSPLNSISASSIPLSAKKAVLYCQKGMRGQSACEKIAESTKTEVFNLDGGLAAWVDLGYDTESSGGSVLPLDRQVQLTIGSLVVIFSLLGLFVNPGFIWASTFVGAGLIVAGTTGFCGLARVMAMMPWNR